MATIGDVALFYAKHGIPVLPLRPRTKEPYKDEGVTVATTDVAIVGEWWSIRPASNIGIPMGPVSGLLGVDIDPRHGAPADRNELIAQYGPWEETAEAETGNPGGRHLYFLWPEDLINLPQVIAPGIGLRGSGLYLMAPPSIHPNGKRYNWDGSAGYESILHIAPLPARLRELIVGNGNGHKTTTLEECERIIREAVPEIALAAIPEEQQFAKAFATDPKTKQLWEGNREGYPSRSESDEALCCKLIFWFGHDPAKIERLFRKSGLMYERWDDYSYRTRTLASSLAFQTVVYTPPAPRESASHAPNGSAGNGAGPDGGAAAPPKPKRFKDGSLDWREIPSIWDLEIQVDWIIEDLLVERGVTLITGDSGHGKTTFVTALCKHIVNGTAFLGREVQKRPVLYIDYENDAGIVKQHLFDLHFGRNDNFRVWGQWHDRFPKSPNAHTLVDFARETQGVLVFDSLIGGHPGNEQDASETRRYLQNFRTLTAVGGSVMLVHHTGKAETSKQYRGSSDIKAFSDMCLLLEKIGEDDAGLIKEVKLRAFKNRMGSFEPMDLLFHDGEFISSRETPRVASDEELVFGFIRMYPGSGMRDMLKMGRQANIGRVKLQRILDNGVRKGRLEIVQGLKGKSGFHLVQVPIVEL